MDLDKEVLIHMPNLNNCDTFSFVQMRHLKNKNIKQKGGYLLQ